jgi:hypothetical protein
MQKPSYKISVGSTIIDSAKPSSGRLVSIFTEKSMTIPADISEIVVGVPFGSQINKTDKISIELGYSERLMKIFSGSVDRISPSITNIIISGFSPFTALFSLRKNITRLNQKSGKIVSYLANEAGIETSMIDDGFELPYYVIDSGKNAYEHCIGLSKRNGFDFYCDEEGKLVFKKFSKTRADHIFTYAKEILTMQADSSNLLYEGVEIYGESPIGSKGKDTWCWYTKDFAPNKGSEGRKEKSLLIQDSIIRTKDAATVCAQAKLNFMKKSLVFGSAIVPGDPNIKLGDAVEFKGCPQDELNQLFQVKQVRHTLNKDSGFRTEIGFYGTGEK